MKESSFQPNWGVLSAAGASAPVGSGRKNIDDEGIAGAVYALHGEGRFTPYRLILLRLVCTEELAMYLSIFFLVPEPHPISASPGRLVQSSRRLSTLGLSMLGWLLWLLSSASSVVAQDLNITWTGPHGGPAPSALEVGDHLWVGATGVQPQTAYRLQLVDEGFGPVTEKQVVSDETGRIDALPIWAYTGVVGCNDEGEPAATGAYEYVTFDDAEADLSGRVFELLLIGQDSDEILAHHAFELIARQSPLFFFADVNRCLREAMLDADDLYLAGRSLPEDGADWIFFLVDAQDPLNPGDPIHEIRRQYQSSPQVIPSEAGITLLLELAWLGLESEPGRYSGVVRRDDFKGAFVTISDKRIGNPITDGGGTGIDIQHWRDDEPSDSGGGG